MSLRKRTRTEFPWTFNNYNETNDGNPSHDVDENTNFFLRNITLENIDESVFAAFDKRFIIANKAINLIPLDAELTAMRFQNPVEYDELKGYLNLPYFTMWRNSTNPLYRVSATNKPLVYAIPRKKAQGVVYDEYIMPVPQLLSLGYTFKFITTYREHTNSFEQFMLEYFKNKRNVIVLDGERFEIMPAAPDVIGALEVVEREGSNGQSLYVLTFEMKVTAYLRDIKQIKKRERPNTLFVQISERSGPRLTSILKTETRLPKIGPEKPIDPSQKAQDIK